MHSSLSREISSTKLVPSSSSQGRWFPYGIIRKIPRSLVRRSIFRGRNTAIRAVVIATHNSSNTNTRGTATYWDDCGLPKACSRTTRSRPIDRTLNSCWDSSPTPFKIARLCSDLCDLEYRLQNFQNMAYMFVFF